MERLKKCGPGKKKEEGRKLRGRKIVKRHKIMQDPGRKIKKEVRKFQGDKSEEDSNHKLSVESSK